MAYFFITDDNKIYAGGGNYLGETGTNTSGGSSSYAYALYPPREIVYETKDGTILDGSMVKSIVSGTYHTSSSGSLLLTNDGEVFACGYNRITGDKTQHKIFNKISKDKNGNELPKIDKVFMGTSTAFLLTKEGVVYSSGRYNGRSTSEDYYYDIISTDFDGNLLPPIVDIFSTYNFYAFLTNEGEVYTFGSANNYGLYDDILEYREVYYPIKTKLKNIVKVSLTNSCFLCLDKFGQIWANGYLSYFGYTPYTGKYYDNSTYVPYLNLNKFEVSDVYMQFYNDTTKYSIPKRILDIMPLRVSHIIKYLDEDNKINILTQFGYHKYFGAGTSPYNNYYLYNHRGSTGIWDFENEYEGIYNFDHNAIGTIKEGKLYVSGGAGTNGSTSDNFTSAKILPGTEDLTITRVFGANSMNEIIIKDELYPMPDISNSKIKIQSMV